MISGFSYLDAALVAIVAISGIVAMYRGLTREILSILSWVAAAAACVYFVFKFKAEAQQVADQFHSPLLVAQVGIGGLIFLLVVIPFMFYEAFVDKPEQQYPWVRDAVSRPYIKSTGDSLRIILQRLVPSSLMGPEQQQGYILEDDNNRVAGAGG